MDSGEVPTLVWLAHKANQVGFDVYENANDGTFHIKTKSGQLVTIQPNVKLAQIFIDGANAFKDF